MHNLVIIPARRNSIRLKNKNLLKIQNKTLVEHSINFAKKNIQFCNILVSTDSKKIIEISIKKKVLCPWIRPKKFSTSKSSTESVISHALKWYEKNVSIVDFIILLQPTTPFRTKKTFNRCLESVKKNPLSTIITFKKNKKFFFQMKKKKLVLKNENFIEPTGSIYIISSNKFKKFNNIYSGKVTPILTSNEIENIDIDYEQDYSKAKKYLRGYNK